MSRNNNLPDIGRILDDTHIACNSGGALQQVSQQVEVRSTPAPYQGPTSGSQVWIRFVTPSGAITHVNLSRLPAFTTAFPSHTKLSDLTREIRSNAAMESIRSELDLRASGSGNEEIDLHAAAFHLSYEQATLEDYRLEGSKEDPLNVYAVKRTSNVMVALPRALANYNGLSACPAWYPNPGATAASVATFLSSLYMLRMKLTDNTVRRRILTALWETTHFPPVIRAMAILFDNGELRNADKAALVQTFYVLAKGMVPESVIGGSADPTRIMEGSRQVIGWIVDQVISRKRGGAGSEEEDIWCPKVIVQPKASVHGRDFDSSELGNKFVTIRPPGKASVPITYLVKYMNLDDREHPEPAQLAMAFAATAVHGGNNYLVFPRRFINFHLHRIVSYPSPEGFYELVVNTNSIPALGVVPPLSLTRQQPPCLTLDEYGRLAVWDLGRPCSSEWARFWSPVSGETPIINNDRGQSMARRLEPIVREKKEQGCWILDGWDIGGINISSVDTRRPSEAVVICIDISSSMEDVSGLSYVSDSPGLSYMDGYPKREPDTMSRLGRAKELFKLFSQTVSNLDVPVYFGGFSFDHKVTVFNAMKTRMTPLIGHVWDEVEALNPRGSTALWDALHEAAGMLAGFKTSQPDSKLRIIALTDGENNASRRSASEVMRTLWTNNIVVDSVVIGNNVAEQHEIFKFSTMTGGYGIRPVSVADLTEIGQMETLVDASLRPSTHSTRGPVLLPYHQISMMPTYDLTKPPPLAPHPNQHDTFIRLTFAQRLFRKSYAASGNTVSRYTAAATTARRLTEEMQEVLRNPHPNMDAFVSERNLYLWKVIMEGPSQTPYQNGTFVFLMDMTDDFPVKPPKLRFLTPILHPNITRQGRVCHPILDDAWTSNTPLREVMGHMFGLLIAPEIESSAVDVISTLSYMSSDRLFTAEVADHIRRHAQQGREALSMAISSPDKPSTSRASPNQSSPSSITGGSPIYTPLSMPDCNEDYENSLPHSDDDTYFHI